MYKCVISQKDPQCFVTPSGSKEFPIFEYDETGELVDTGKKENVFDKIQSFEAEVLLSNIIRRCGITGESLEAPSTSFGDSRVLPKDLLDAKDKMNQVQGFVDSLSNEDLKLLNEKGFDDFLSAKIAAMSVNKDNSKKVGENDEQ